MTILDPSAPFTHPFTHPFASRTAFSQSATSSGIHTPVLAPRTVFQVLSPNFAMYSS
jgi:hypothetical protein